MSQLSLTGEPDLQFGLSQYFTPLWICRLLAAWVPPTVRVLEPSCGSGNMIAALLERGHDPELITAVEIDPHWADYARARFNGQVHVITGDFFEVKRKRWNGASPFFDMAWGNPKFEENSHARFIRHCLQLCPLVCFVLPTSVEYSRERDGELWAKHARITRRAKLPDRVKYGGDNQASFDSEVLKIVRRDVVRPPDEINLVMEEVWCEVTSQADAEKGTA
jgi:SAM-dependent methyltransferase